MILQAQCNKGCPSFECDTRNSWMQLSKNCHITKELIIVGSPPAFMPGKGVNQQCTLKSPVPSKKNAT